MKSVLTLSGACGALALLACSATAQDAEDFTSRLNRAPGQATAPSSARPGPETVSEPTGGQPPILPDLTARLNQMRAASTTETTPEPVPAPEPEQRLQTPEPDTPQGRPPAPAPSGMQERGPNTSPPRSAPESGAISRTSPAPAPDTPQIPSGLAFRVDLPADVELIERPSGPGFDVYQVSRESTPLVGIHVGCCSLFPIYEGRRAEAAGRLSILVNEDGGARAVEHLFVRESDGRQIHVWLYSVTGEDRALAERIAQTVDPR